MHTFPFRKLLKKTLATPWLRDCWLFWEGRLIDLLRMPGNPDSSKNIQGNTTWKVSHFVNELDIQASFNTLSFEVFFYVRNNYKYKMSIHFK